ERKKVSTAPRPGKRGRTSPIAARLPRTVATTAVRNPMPRLTRNDCRKVSLAKNAWYQRRERPFGGKSKVAVEPNDTTATTTSGASRTTYTAIANGQRNRGDARLTARSPAERGAR